MHFPLGIALAMAAACGDFDETNICFLWFILAIPIEESVFIHSNEGRLVSFAVLASMMWCILNLE